VARPDDPPIDGEVRLLAVIGTWMEADIIASTVANAYAQGCERVMLVDNDSPDDTVAVGVAAGAELADTFRTETHDDDERARRSHAVALAASESMGAEHVWCLFLDADELPTGGSGRTIAEHLAGVSSRARVVGSRTFHHFPDSPIAHEPGKHPADHQPLCQERRSWSCGSGHWKHPLIRLDRTGTLVTPGRGFHIAHCPDRLFEAAEPIISHHFPFRNEADTRARIAALTRLGPTGVSRLVNEQWAMARRAANLDAIYGQRWVDVDVFDMLLDGDRLAPLPWDAVAPGGHALFARWYVDEHRAVER
jgi:glycosyltransferase involved in cell wall biosynthesis